MLLKYFGIRQGSALVVPVGRLRLLNLGIISRVWNKSKILRSESFLISENWNSSLGKYRIRNNLIICS